MSIATTRDALQEARGRFDGRDWDDIRRRCLKFGAYAPWYRVRWPRGMAEGGDQILHL